MSRFALVLLSSLSLLGCYHHVDGGPEVSKTRTLEKFTRLRVEGVPVRFSPGPPQVTINAQQKVEENVQTLVFNDALIVRLKPGVAVDSFDNTEIILSAEGVSSFEVMHGGRLDATGLVAQQLLAEVSGRSELSLAGATTALDLEAKSGARVDASKLVSELVSLDVSGASTLDVHATKSVAGNVWTGSTVRVFGGGDVSAVSVTGGSTLTPASN